MKATIITVGQADALKAQTAILCCDECFPDAEIPFDWVLAEVTGRHGNVDFVLEEKVACPRCGREIERETLVEPTCVSRTSAPEGKDVAISAVQRPSQTSAREPGVID